MMSGISIHPNAVVPAGAPENPLNDRLWQPPKHCRAHQPLQCNLGKFDPLPRV